MAAPILASVHDIELQVVDGDAGKLHPSSSARRDQTSEIDLGTTKDAVRLSDDKLPYPSQEGSMTGALASEDANGLEAATGTGLPIRAQSAAVEWFQFSTLSMCMFLAGWNDAIVGQCI